MKEPHLYASITPDPRGDAKHLVVPIEDLPDTFADIGEQIGITYSVKIMLRTTEWYEKIIEL